MQHPSESGQLRQHADAHSEAIAALMLRARDVAETVIHGEHTKRKAGSGESFWQFRDYTPSDRPQDIDWRQSAKGDHVFVKDRERQNAQNIALWCSSASSMDFSSAKSLPPKKMAAQTLALAMAILLTRGHEKVRMIDGNFKSGHSENTLMLIAEHLVSSHNADLESLPLLNAKLNETHIWISDFLEEPDLIAQKLKDANAKQNRSNNILIQVLDPAEVTLPYEGRCLFEGQEISQRIENVASIREEYAVRINAHINSIREHAARQGWQFFSYQTDQDMSAFLYSASALLSDKQSGGGARP